jgi:tRNA threonylcarbamoyladenosine biosynthesis protein TsaE
MISRSLKDTENIAFQFAKGVGPRPAGAAVIALSGDLGSGKTTFTKSLATYFGISAEEVTSPTFVIEKRFALKNNSHFHTLIHIDAYRLEKPEEIERLGWRETVADKGNLVLIEWPENIGGALPKDALKISFKCIDENTREIVFN